MSRWQILPGVAIALLAATLSLPAQAPDPHQRKPPLQMDGYDWQKDAHANGLTDEQIITLKKQGFVVTGNTCKQSFFPYLGGEQLFVTSDTIANTYSVLLEESVRLLEATNATRLNTYLVEAWKETPSFEKRFTGDPALLKDAYLRVRMVMGVALELSSGQKVDAPPELQKAIDEEAQRVISANGMSKPEWLGPPDDGFEAIDYSRFKPRGVYNGRPALERYFRATAWLQAIPFRFSKDAELTAWLMLYEGLDDFNNKPLYNAENEIYEPGMGGIASSMKMALMMLVGEPDDADLFGDGHEGLSDDGWNAQSLDDLRQHWAKSGPGADDGVVRIPAINDQLAVTTKKGKPERTFRILSAYRLPDAAMFSDTNPNDFPSGREVAAALGSTTARAYYRSNDPDLLTKIDKDKNAFATGTLYSDYLNAMATLFEPVDPTAPDLFHSSAWQEKSLQTFLGGWAQDRHAWLLQTKQNVLMLSDFERVPSGFVEPVPDFFNRMAQLSLKSLQIFQEAGAFDHGLAEVVQNYRDAAEALRRYAAARKIDPKARPSAADSEILMNNEGVIMSLTDPTRGKPRLSEEEEATKLDQIATQLETQGPGNDHMLKMEVEFKGAQAAKKWQAFASLSLKLEELANKQLHHVPLSDEDNQFYYEFGKTLASFMGYDSNEFESVHDDAPRIADIYSDPQKGQVLEVGIGRPLVMYLLYPYGGKSILTHGAVLPYYEFASGERLTDQSWADLLTTPSAPSPPEWLKDVTSKPIPPPPKDTSGSNKPR